MEKVKNKENIGQSDFMTSNQETHKVEEKHIQDDNNNVNYVNIYDNDNDNDNQSLNLKNIPQDNSAVNYYVPNNDSNSQLTTKKSTSDTTINPYHERDHMSIVSTSSLSTTAMLPIPPSPSSLEPLSKNVNFSPTKVDSIDRSDDNYNDDNDETDFMDLPILRYSRIKNSNFQFPKYLWFLSIIQFNWKAPFETKIIIILMIKLNITLTKKSSDLKLNKY